MSNIPVRHALVKGASFRGEQAKAFVSNLSIGDTLLLEREPENPYDENAIKVLDDTGTIHLAYIARELAELIAPDMDAGQVFSCIVVEFIAGGRVTYPKVKIEPVEAVSDPQSDGFGK